ncbi:MAG: DUF4492 domain-containing protein [Bacteroidales bacterium]|nr:DUF4492 domain-containing protein [Bacteroidales bacterium]
MLKKVFMFYYQGFKTMTWGKSLWAIILIKLFIMFVILKVFFFPDILQKEFDSDAERSNYVLEQITNSNTK